MPAFFGGRPGRLLLSGHVILLLLGVCGVVLEFGFLDHFEPLYFELCLPKSRFPVCVIKSINIFRPARLTLICVCSALHASDVQLSFAIVDRITAIKTLPQRSMINVYRELSNLTISYTWIESENTSANV